LAEPDKVAASVGLGRLDRSGRLKTAKLGTKLHIADVILTDLPMKPDKPPS
jgi:epoxyqueuosine reductase QueG